MADTRIEAGTPECAVSALRTEPFRFRWYPVNGAIMSLIALALWKNSYKKTEPEHQNRRLKIACEVSDKTERSWDNNKGQVIINTSLPLNCPSEILSVYQGETVPNAGRLSSECSLRNKWCCVCGVRRLSSGASQISTWSDCSINCLPRRWINL